MAALHGSCTTKGVSLPHPLKLMVKETPAEPRGDVAEENREG